MFCTFGTLNGCDGAHFLFSVCFKNGYFNTLDLESHACVCVIPCSELVEKDPNMQVFYNVCTAHIMVFFGVMVAFDSIAAGR